MHIEIDFNSDEALYIQLKNQIIFAIATDRIKDGESLPSVRSLAEDIGINMHTVNKAYNILKDDGFVRVDRRRGVVVCIDIDKINTLQAMKTYLMPLIASGIAKGVSADEVKELVDDIYEDMT